MKLAIENTMTVEEAYEIERELAIQAKASCERLQELYDAGVRLVTRDTLEPYIPDNVIVFSEHRRVQ